LAACATPGPAATEAAGGPGIRRFLGDEPYDPTPNPERSLIAFQELAAIDQLFADVELK
jgi:hypothetical protein